MADVVSAIHRTALETSGRKPSISDSKGIRLPHSTHFTDQIQLLLAFICYATAETRPTPLLSNRFFHDLVTVTKALRDEHLKMGIGSTGSVKAGMSALEGLVAALEVNTASPGRYTRSLIVLEDVRHLTEGLSHHRRRSQTCISRPSRHVLHH